MCFYDQVDFSDACFHGDARFHEAWARLDHDSCFPSEWPVGWTVIEADPEGEWEDR